MYKVNNTISLSVVTPALNEEQNLLSAAEAMVAAFNAAGIDWEIIIVDDGSTDRTKDIADALARQEPRIRALHHRRPMGVGWSFRDGALAATKDAVTYLPGDGENDPAEVIKYAQLLQYVDIVVPFVTNKEVRPRSRRYLSALYLWIVNFSFGTTFNYTNGNVIYKKRVFEVVHSQANSFFFQTEYLLKATRAGFIFAEVPIRIRGRQRGKSKAVSFKSFVVLFKEFIRLWLNLRILFFFRKKR